jgi:hypothetical protein
MFNAFLVTPATCFLSPEQDIRAFTELVHSPDGGHVLFSKKHSKFRSALALLAFSERWNL